MLSPDDILFEDNHLIAINKKPGDISQGDKTGDVHLGDKVKEYLKFTYSKSGNVYLGLLHRLDRPVSGVMLFAKTSKAAERLSSDIQQKKMAKDLLGHHRCKTSGNSRYLAPLSGKAGITE